jgi:hypothetical protein
VGHFCLRGANSEQQPPMGLWRTRVHEKDGDTEERGTDCPRYVAYPVGVRLRSSACEARVFLSVDCRYFRSRNTEARDNVEGA